MLAGKTAIPVSLEFRGDPHRVRRLTYISEFFDTGEINVTFTVPFPLARPKAG